MLLTTPLAIVFHGLAVLAAVIAAAAPIFSWTPNGSVTFLLYLYQSSISNTDLKTTVIQGYTKDSFCQFNIANAALAFVAIFAAAHFLMLCYQVVCLFRQQRLGTLSEAGVSARTIVACTCSPATGALVILTIVCSAISIGCELGLWLGSPCDLQGANLTQFGSTYKNVGFVLYAGFGSLIGAPVLGLLGCLFGARGMRSAGNAEHEAALSSGQQQQPPPPGGYSGAIYQNQNIPA